MPASIDPLGSPSTTVERNSYIPYYVQVKEALREGIDRGDWQAGDQLPGEAELCRMFDVSRTVVRQALKEMTYEGSVVRAKGKGSFIAEPKVIESLAQKLTGFYQDMVERGHNPVTQVLKQSFSHANPKVAAHLGVKPGTPVIKIERLRFIQDEPIVLVTTYLPYTLCPEVVRADLSHQSLYAFLEKQCGLVIARGRRTLEAVPANEYEARHLQVKKGAPLIMLDSVSYLSDGTPIEYYHALHRGDRSRFEVELVRIREQGKAREVLGGEATELPQSNELVR
ncbi:MAG: GntR family transcriptional regulator [Candidatus Bipolaricaulia bacterium]